MLMIVCSGKPNWCWPDTAIMALAEGRGPLGQYLGHVTTENP